MIWLIAFVPWIALVVYVLIKVRLPRPLPGASTLMGATDRSAPLVSVIIPARNEERSIRLCVESISASDYPDFEVIVVDDRSDDATLELARAIPPNHARRVVVVEGDPLPEGWMGKPWACAQGAKVAQGDLLLFTDADTIHAPELLGRAVAGMMEDEGDALTLLGRQLMETFWERLVQTHMMAAMVFRFPNPGKPLPPERWRDAIANGQFMLFDRDAYEEIGGHEAVKGEIVEDQRLAQILCRSGKRLTVRAAETAFATRMYRSLEELIEGWSKNLSLAARQSVPRWAVPIVMPAGIVVGVLIWIVPPMVLLMSLAGFGPGGSLGVGPNGWVTWSAWITGLSVIAWSLVSWRLKAPFWVGAFYPLASGVVNYIFLRSWIRGGRVEWKGREYRV
ncbi:MAG: glycosyltransferase [Gemmatimonadetes bacterium]|nr:glycosyltransferase [Gemmatimonadota bacterium]